MTIKVDVPSGTSAPDLSAPDLAVPDLSMPDLSMPDLSMPDLSMPEMSAPDVSSGGVGSNAVQVSMTDAVVSALAVIGAGVDVLQGLLKVVEADPVQAGATEPAAWRSVLERVDRVGRSLSAGRVRVARIGEQVRVPGHEGQVDAGSWVATTTRTTRTDAARLMDLARGLHGLPATSPTRLGEAARTRSVGTSSGDPGAGDLPAGPMRLTATEAALDAGDVSVDHARIILATMAGLPTHLSPQDRTAIELRLVGQARLVDPGTLRRLARRAVEAIEPDPVVVDEMENATLADEEERAYRASSFWIKDNCDGTMSGGFTVPWVSGAALKTVLDAMTAPRKVATGTSPAKRATGINAATPAPTATPAPSAAKRPELAAPEKAAAGGGSGPGSHPPGQSGQATASSRDSSHGESEAELFDLRDPIVDAPGAGLGRSACDDAATVGRAVGRAARVQRPSTGPDRTGTSHVGVASGETGLDADVGHGRDLSLPSPGPVEPRGPGSWKDRTFEWQQRRGMAFADLLTLIPTDHLPNKAAATVLVHIDLDTLRGQTDKAGRTSAGDSLSAATVRRAACLAGIVPAVLGRDSTPLNLGRTTRLFTPAQRLALSTRYDSCAAAGCDRPFAWTEIHHLQPWEAGGRTDLSNAVPLCGFHHRRLHQLGIRHEVHRDAFGRVTITFTRV